MIDKYTSIPLSERPHYVMIVGSPARVSFRFQAFLGVACSVGRLDFDSLDELATYVDKLLRLEQADVPPATTPNVLFFAPEYGPDPSGRRDPTYFSRRFMVDPLIDVARKTKGFTVTERRAERATKAELLECVGRLKPALVYTASHGVSASDQDPEVQRRLNGALCCQPTGSEHQMEDYLLTAEDIPADQPFLEGAVLFQFACFGYGTPAASDFARWDVSVPARNAPEDFVAALPKKLVAHPRGPIGFIGHVDLAWLHAFDDPDHPELKKRWHPRLVPFRSAVETLLARRPTGFAMRDITTRYAFMNTALANVLEAKEGGEYEDTDEARNQLASDFITRCDAQTISSSATPPLVSGSPARCGVTGRMARKPRSPKASHGGESGRRMEVLHFAERFIQQSLRILHHLKLLQCVV